MADSFEQLAEKKLIILYLIEKMRIALSNSEICQFSLEKNYMDYFSVQQYLEELVEAELIEKNKEKHSTRYTITDKGEEVIHYFSNHIPLEIKEVIDRYTHENQKRIHAEYEVTANYFLEMDHDYLVKCCLSDNDGSSLMEVSVSVATKNQAKLICNNWKKNVSKLYGAILSVLAKDISKQ